MYSELINDLTIELYSCKILNIYTSDKKIIIGVGGIPKENVEFNSFGIIIKEAGRNVWYSYNDIKKIEVY